ncbi:MAG: response regulator [Candidatus Riflebacteria bacterium]|nr:response regulator [Candidatus Riflebacteria bacterium]
MENYKILIVDDSKYMRFALRRILINAGFQKIEEADSGEQALAIYPVSKPNLVTMDHNMNGMSGIEATKNIVKLDPNAKICMVTAYDNNEDFVKEAFHAGAKGFIVKPFKTEKVLEAILKLAGFTAAVIKQG